MSDNNTLNDNNIKPSLEKKTRILLFIYLAFNILFIIINLVLYLTNPARGLVPKWLFFAALIFGILSIWAVVIHNFFNLKDKIIRMILKEFVLVSLVFLIICLFIGQLFGLASVDGISMTPTLKNKQLIMINRYNHKVRKGQIVIIDVSVNKKGSYIVKRVAATPGMWLGLRYNINQNAYDIYTGLNKFDPGVKYEITSVSGHYDKLKDQNYNNKHPLLSDDEAARLVDILLRQVKNSNLSKEELLKKVDNNTKFFIPEGFYFCLGDHYVNSLDSKYHGFFTRSQIVATKIGG